MEASKLELSKKDKCIQNMEKEIEELKNSYGQYLILRKSNTELIGENGRNKDLLEKEIKSKQKLEEKIKKLQENSQTILNEKSSLSIKILEANKQI